MMLHSIIQSLQVFQTCNFKMVEIFPFTFSSLSPLGELSILLFCDGSLGEYRLQRGCVFRREGLSDERKQVALFPCHGVPRTYSLSSILGMEKRTLVTTGFKI